MEFGRRDANDPYFKKIYPATMFEFRKIRKGDPLHIPELAKNRVSTNTTGFFCFSAMVVAWMVFVIYLSREMDVKKFRNGVDFCGNICGIKNVEISNREHYCRPEDNTHYPTLMYIEVEGALQPIKCVVADQCSEYDTILNRCFSRFNKTLIRTHPRIDVYIMFDTFYKNLNSIVVTIIFSVAVSIIVITALWINSRYTFLTFILVQTFVFNGTNGLTWYVYVQVKERLYIYFGSFLTTITLFFFAMLPFLLAPQRFNLIVGLYQEAAVNIFNIPWLFLLPLLSISFLFLVNGIAYWTLMLVFSDTNEQTEEYSSLQTSYFIFMAIILVWMYSFVNGCQCMIVSGAIASYYFTRNKNQPMEYSLMRSMWVTVRYHMGSVAVGSLVITVLSFIKFLAHFIRRMIGRYPEEQVSAQPTGMNTPVRQPSRNSPASSVLAGGGSGMTSAAAIIAKQYNSCFTSLLEEPAEYLTKNAYIMTAIHGKSLFISGKRAARLTWYFMLDTIIVDSLGYLVMHGFSFMIFLTALAVAFTLMSLVIEQITIYYVLMLGYLAGTVTYFFFGILNVTAETILLCFCEDKILADLMSAEYFMTKSLEQLMISISVLTKKPEAVRTRAPTSPARQARH